MQLSVTPIGVNGAFTVEGFHTSYLLEDGEDSLLVDCGTTSARALQNIKKNLVEIASVYISHMHLDHVGGLYDLGMLRYLAKKPRPKIYLHKSLASPLWDNFLSGLLSRYVDLNGESQIGTPDTFFDFIPIDGTVDSTEEPFSLGNLSLRLVPVRHVQGAPSYGIVVNDIVFISSDTVFMPDLLDKLSNAYGLRAIFHDCAFANEKRCVHATYEELCLLPEDLKELLILTHYETNYKQYLKKGEKLQLSLAAAGERYTFK